jgi:AcrR family transcriptional regulator
MDLVKDKRTILLEAAISLFGERGFWNTSTALVAKHAGVATGTLFNYFPSKEDLIREVMVYLKREMMSNAAHGFDPNAELRDQLESLWFNGLKWGMANWTRFHLMEQIRVSERIAKEAEAMGQQYAEVMMLFAKGVEEGKLQPLAPELIAEMMFRQAQAVAEFLLFHGTFSTAENNAHLTTSFEVFWNGISRNQP